MKIRVSIEIENEHELARLITLVEDGKKILNKQGRNQRGIDGYTYSDLDNWEEKLSSATSVRCQFANSDI